MYKIKLTSPTSIQLFFIEKTYELLNKHTIDTYRLRLHNPKSLIKELIEVSENLLHNRLKNKEYAISLCKELTRLINEKDSLICFINIEKSFYLKLIDTSKDFDANAYKKIITVSTIVLNENSNYFNQITKHLLKTFLRFSLKEPNYEDYESINKVIHYFYLELIYNGYSKYYLRDFTLAIFSGIENKSFYERFLIIKNVYTKAPEEYSVIMGINNATINANNFKLLDEKFKILKKSDKKRFTVITNDTVRNFLIVNNNHVLFSYSCAVKDYYTALTKAKESILKAVDIYHLSVSNKNLEILNECAVIGSIDSSKAKVYDTSYVIDGYNNSHINLYKILSGKIENIFISPGVETEAKNKINAGLRYLRLGSEAKDLGNKFINYWIGLEYLFSIHDASSNTFGRIKFLLKTAHAVIYIKRNLNDFHLSLKTRKFPLSMLANASNLEYLLEDTTYDAILKQKSITPLMKFRAMFYRKMMSSKKIMEGVLEKHQQNIEWNIIRIYRLRNEIVHNAAIKPEMEIIVSHLRYYLTFSINAIIDFLHSPTNNTDGKKIDLEDFFNIQEILLSNFKMSDTIKKEFIINKNIFEIIV